MNTNRIAPRLFFFALAAMITGSMLAGVDTLAQSGHVANSLLAQAAQQHRQPAVMAVDAALSAVHRTRLAHRRCAV